MHTHSHTTGSPSHHARGRNGPGPVRVRVVAALCAVAAQLWLRLPGERRRPSSTVLLAAYRSNAPNLHACPVTTERQRT